MKNKFKQILQKALGLSTYHTLIERKIQILNQPEARQNNQALGNMTSFYQQFLQPGDLCFDVGANMGNRVEAFLKIGANVVVVEPQ
jgi:hypothetical protein